MDAHDGEADELPPPPPVPANVVPIKADDVESEVPANKPAKPKRFPMARPGLGRKGQPIQLLANHYKVSVKSSEEYFFHYNVGFFSNLLSYIQFMGIHNHN
jgi:eukaryotic translation initiation factor 2C